MKPSFTSLVTDTDREEARALLYKTIKLLDFRGFSMKSLAMILFKMSVRGLQVGSEHAPFLAKNDNFDVFDGFEDKKRLIRTMTDSLGKRQHMTTYTKDMDGFLMRQIEAFENTATDARYFSSSQDYMINEAVIRDEIAEIILTNCLHNKGFDEGSVALALQDAACVCLALAPISHPYFMAVLKTRRKHLEILLRQMVLREKQTARVAKARKKQG